jgi:hypothetical protein
VVRAPAINETTPEIIKFLLKSIISNLNLLTTNTTNYLRCTSLIIALLLPNTTTAAVDSLLARKIDNATAGLRPFLAKALCRLSEDNAGTITDYIQSLNEEINASNNYRRNVIAILCSFSEYNNKPFRQITREDILAFLDSFRRPESIDPQHMINVLLHPGKILL